MNRTLVRTRGCMAQFITLGVSRGGHIEAFPTLYVVGAKNLDTVMTGTAGIYALDQWNWIFDPFTPLDEAFAKLIIERIEKATPLSFIHPLEDQAMMDALKWFNKPQHWMINWNIAFLYLCQGNASAKPYLAKVEKYLAKICIPPTKYTSEMDNIRWQRVKTLQTRMSEENSVLLCRQEAEQHAADLGLPPLIWPSEWPTVL